MPNSAVGKVCKYFAQFAKNTLKVAKKWLNGREAGDRFKLMIHCGSIKLLEVFMKIYKTLASLLLVLSSQVAGAFEYSKHAIKSLVLTRDKLEELRANQPNFLQGIDLRNDQILKVDKNIENQIINISVFKVKGLGESRVDERQR